MDILKIKGVKAQDVKGTKYVYIDKPYWDKDKKQNRHTREYIGKLGVDGQFIANKKYLSRQNNDEVNKETPPIADRKFFGATHLLDCISEKVGIKSDLISSFGEETALKIMSLAYFLVLESESSMYRFPKFAKTHRHPYGEVISSQRISDIFARITENEKAKFFKSRAKRCLRDEFLTYDTTSISSYSEMIEQIKYGHNKDLENLPQINLAMVFGEKSKLPVYYRKLAGNIADVSTIKKLLIDMDFLGLEKVNFVLDRGFYSRENVNALYRNKHKFIVGGRANTAVVKEAIAEMREKVKEWQNYNELHDVYCITKKDKWSYEFVNKKGEKTIENRQFFVHTYYDGEKAEHEKKVFVKRLKVAETAYSIDACTEIEKKLVEKYFFVQGRKTKANQATIDEHLNSFGYFVLLSNYIDCAETALSIYRNKDVVEKTFCNLKNRLDMNRTKVSSEEALEGKFFVQFVALTFVSHLHQVMQKNNLYKNYSLCSLLDELDIIEIFNYQSKKTHTSEITKKQRAIFEYFEVDIQTTL